MLGPTNAMLLQLSQRRANREKESSHPKKRLRVYDYFGVSNLPRRTEGKGSSSAGVRELGRKSKDAPSGNQNEKTNY